MMARRPIPTSLVDTFRIEPYGGEVLVVVDEHPSRIALLRGLELDADNAAADHECSAQVVESHVRDDDGELVRGRWAVFLRPAFVTPNTVAHETFHLTMFVAAYYGLDLEVGEPDEHLAYLHGYLFERVWKAAGR